MIEESKKTEFDFLPKNWGTFHSASSLKRLARAKRKAARWNSSYVLEIDDETRELTIDGVVQEGMEAYHDNGKLVIEVE